MEKKAFKLTKPSTLRHRGYEVVEHSVRVTVLSPFVELLQSPFSLHKAESYSAVTRMLKKFELGSLSSNGLQGQVPFDLSASSVTMKEILSTLNASK